MEKSKYSDWAARNIELPEIALEGLVDWIADMSAASTCMQNRNVRKESGLFSSKIQAHVVASPLISSTAGISFTIKLSDVDCDPLAIGEVKADELGRQETASTAAPIIFIFQRLGF